jgi:hypothetical protein
MATGDFFVLSFHVFFLHFSHVSLAAAHFAETKEAPPHAHSKPEFHSFLQRSRARTAKRQLRALSLPSVRKQAVAAQAPRPIHHPRQRLIDALPRLSIRRVQPMPYSPFFCATER